MIKFLVFSDLHYDEAVDGDKRIEDILQRAKSKEPDFIVSLGDLCNPVNENKRVLERFNSLGIPFYSVIGNHETDECNLSEILEFFSMSRPYYSVICKGYKLIFLNTCYMQNDEQQEMYYKNNYKNSSYVYPIVPKEEVQWLQEQLKAGMKSVIFSHHSLVNDSAKRGVNNRRDILELFAENQVLLCMNGHDHGDNYSLVDKVSYFTVNSANYAWVGGYIARSKKLQEKYSYLHGMLQYKQAMSAYIEIDDSRVKICGMEGAYLSVTPDDIELYDYKWNGVSIKPWISSHLIKLQNQNQGLQL